MKISYYEETDSLYIDLSSRPSVETQEVSPDINLDYDESHCLVGIDIDHASRYLDLREMSFVQLPLRTHAVAA